MHDELKPFLISAEYQSITVRMENSGKRPFWVRSSPTGLEFFSSVSGGGVHDGSPITINAAELFAMIGEMEGPSGQKFKHRQCFKQK